MVELADALDSKSVVAIPCGFDSRLRPTMIMVTELGIKTKALFLVDHHFDHRNRANYPAFYSKTRNEIGLFGALYPHTTLQRN